MDVQFLDDQYDKEIEARERLPSGFAGVLVKHGLVSNPVYAHALVAFTAVLFLAASLYVSYTAAAPAKYDQAQVLELTNDDFIDYSIDK